MEKVLIDFGALKSGGGCQLALNFIDCLSSLNDIDRGKYFFLLPPKGPLKDLHKKYSAFSYIHSPSDNPVKRVIFEKGKLKRWMTKNDINKIFTFFGTGLPHPKYVTSIVTIAYPIICYEDSLFWSFLPNKNKRSLKLKNKLRLNRIGKANYILVETEIMKNRVSKALNAGSVDFHLLRPSPSNFVQESNRDYKVPEVPRFLFLSGVAPHKNLWRLPELAMYLKNDIANFKFVVSTTEIDFKNHLKDKRALDLFQQTKSFFEFKGTIYPSDINRVYSSSDFLISLSDLESFSNNYMEAWKSGIPLIVSNRDFATEICKDSAIYVEPHKPDVTAKTIADNLAQVEVINRRIRRGKELLEHLPTTEERTRKILEYIENL